MECRLCHTKCYCMGRGCESYLVYVHCDYPDNLCDMCEECEEEIKQSTVTT